MSDKQGANRSKFENQGANSSKGTTVFVKFGANRPKGISVFEKQRTNRSKRIRVFEKHGRNAVEEGYLGKVFEPERDGSI